MWILHFNVYLLVLLVKLVNRLGIDLELICVCVYRVCEGVWNYSGVYLLGLFRGFQWVSYMVFIGIFVGNIG